MTPASSIQSLSRAADSSLRAHVALVAPSMSPEPSAPAQTGLIDANQFIHSLLAMPVATWLAIGRALITDREALVVRQGAWREVEAAIGAHDLAVAAWHVRDALETVVCLVSRGLPCWSREERCQFAATHGAADAAAMGLLASPHVRPDVVRILCTVFSPFLEPPLL